MNAIETRCRYRFGESTVVEPAAMPAVHSMTKSEVQLSS
jgi:hypothetical protein